MHLVFEGDDDISPYFATPDRLLTRAILPEGPVNGLFGKWVGHDTWQGTEIYITIRLLPDHTMTHVIVGGPGEGSTTGTWTFDGQRLAVIEQNGPSYSVPALPGLAIGNDIRERITP